jgi:hypothetical protein
MAAEEPSKKIENSGVGPPGNPAPWDEEVRGADLLDEIVGILQRHIVLPEHAAEAVALWVIHTFVFDRFEHSPRLLVSSPDKRCGKSLLLRFVAALVARPLACENITTAALYRGIQKFSPTLILDEADTILAGKYVNEELRGVINAGFERESGGVLRCAGEESDLVHFSVFGPLAMGMIGKPPSTVEDRSVNVRMRRKMPGECIEKPEPGRSLRGLLEDTLRKIVRWTRDHECELGKSRTSVPASLDDRARNGWFSLCAIADAAGDQWPERARRAAVALSIGRDADASLPLMLLADLRSFFVGRSVDRLETKVILGLLAELEDRPWPDYRNGRPINAYQLARLLAPFGVRPDKWKTNGGTERGYLAESMADAWNRYLGAAPTSALRSATAPPASREAALPGSGPARSSSSEPPPGGAVADGGGLPVPATSDASACGPREWPLVAAEAVLPALTEACPCITRPAMGPSRGSLGGT